MVLLAFLDLNFLLSCRLSFSFDPSLEFVIQERRGSVFVDNSNYCERREMVLPLLPDPMLLALAHAKEEDPATFIDGMSPLKAGNG